MISLSFAAVKEKDYESTVQRINQILTDLYYENSFLLESDCLLPEEKEDFRRFPGGCQRLQQPWRFTVFQGIYTNTTAKE